MSTSHVKESMCMAVMHEDPESYSADIEVSWPHPLLRLSVLAWWAYPLGWENSAHKKYRGQKTSSAIRSQRGGLYFFHRWRQGDVLWAWSFVFIIWICTTKIAYGFCRIWKPVHRTCAARVALLPWQCREGRLGVAASEVTSRRITSDHTFGRADGTIAADAWRQIGSKRR